MPFEICFTALTAAAEVYSLLDVAWHQGDSTPSCAYVDQVLPEVVELFLPKLQPLHLDTSAVIAPINTYGPTFPIGNSSLFLFDGTWVLSGEHAINNNLLKIFCSEFIINAKCNFFYFWSNFSDCSLDTGGYGGNGLCRNLELVITIFSLTTLKLLHWKLNAGLPSPSFLGNFNLTPSWAGRGAVACTWNWCFILTSRAELQMEFRNLSKSLLMFFSPNKHLYKIFQSADGRNWDGASIQPYSFKWK